MLIRLARVFLPLTNAFGDRSPLEFLDIFPTHVRMQAHVPYPLGAMPFLLRHAPSSTTSQGSSENLHTEFKTNTSSIILVGLSHYFHKNSRLIFANADETDMVLLLIRWMLM